MARDSLFRDLNILICLSSVDCYIDRPPSQTNWNSKKFFSRGKTFDKQTNISLASSFSVKYTWPKLITPFQYIQSIYRLTIVKDELELTYLCPYVVHAIRDQVSRALNLVTVRRISHAVTQFRRQFFLISINPFHE